jgi:hypothetical protein
MQPPPTFNFGLALNFFFVYRTLSMRQKTKNHPNQGSIDKNSIFFPSPKSQTQMGSPSAKNASEKFSRLGTFKVPKRENFDLAFFTRGLYSKMEFLKIVRMIFARPGAAQPLVVSKSSTG